MDTLKAITPESFTAVKLLIPRPDLIIIGTGPTTLPVPPGNMKFLEGLNVAVDVMDTQNACQTFNVLNGEGRSVAAALLPSGR